MKASFLMTSALNVAHPLRRRVVAVDHTNGCVDRSLGVPLGQMRLGSHFPLQVRTRPPAWSRGSSLAGFPLQSLTRSSSTANRVSFLSVVAFGTLHTRAFPSADSRLVLHGREALHKVRIIEGVSLNAVVP
jgi:hypothetical protein